MTTSPLLTLLARSTADTDEASLRVDVDPGDGGRVAQITAWDVPLLAGGPGTSLLMRGMYPMAPWAGRVRDGRFEFEGTEVLLTPNIGPHPLHGVAFDRPWQVLSADSDRCRLALGLDWPLGGTAEQEIALHGSGTPADSSLTVTCRLTVTASDRPMPVVIGWHPCFRPATTLTTAFERMYRRDDEGVALDELVGVGQLPWDDCFPADDGPAPWLVVDGVRIDLASDCDHWVVYTGDPAATCVEPQSAPPDAVNGVGRCWGAGPTVLGPGDSMTRTLTLRLSRPV